MMKKSLLILMLTAAFSVVGFGQTKADEKTLMDIEQKIVDAVTSGKFKEIEKYCSSDYTVTTPEGMVLTAKDLASFLQSGDLKLESSVNREMKVKFYGTTALVTYSSSDKGTFKGTPITTNNRWTDIFIKMKGKWMLVMSHGSAVLPI